MKILVIFTGGTIGSRKKDNWLSVDGDTSYTLLSRYENSDIEFSVSNPYSILSENLSAAELNKLLKEIEKNINAGYNGIIVTHGTDTLQYSACAAENSFGNSGIPIVFVSAAYPLEDNRTNGFENFEAAVEFIKSGDCGGVYISYKNSNENYVNIHLPSKVLSHAECDADIYSIDGSLYARYNKKIEKFGLNTENRKELGAFKYCENPQILCVESYPGNSYEYSLEKIKAVILRPYHSATLNTANERFKSFCSEAESKGIPVFLVNAKGGVSYESSKEFEALGIIVLPYGTFISAYMRIWAAISLGKDIRELLE